MHVEYLYIATFIIYCSNYIYHTHGKKFSGKSLTKDLSEFNVHGFHAFL